MASLLETNRLRKLSIEERFSMLKQIWQSIADDDLDYELSEAEWREVERRLRELAHPEKGFTWEQVEPSFSRTGTVQSHHRRSGEIREARKYLEEQREGLGDQVHADIRQLVMLPRPSSSGP